MPRVAIVTLGCPKNAVDSENLAGGLRAAGHEVVEEPRGAEVVVVNTCGFIEAARRETIETALELADLADAGDAGGLVLAGCLVARAGEELAEALPEVDALVDFDAYTRLPEIVGRVAAGDGNGEVHGAPGTRFDPAWWDASLAGGPRLRFGRAPWSYVKIAEGCDRRCTFCAIPLMRGRLRSRPAALIEEEVRALVAQGVTELSLVSQDSVMWGRDTGEGDLLSLLGRLERIEGVRRLRLMYLHPQGVDERLVDAVLGSEVVCSYFDLSLQHVSARVLKAMGRGGGRARFEGLAGRIRRLDPLAGLRASFILGFPGESEDEAAEVESFVAGSELDWVGVFTYSAEPGTRSHDLPGRIPQAEARARAEAVSTAAESAMARRAADLVGAHLEVLVERLDVSDGTWRGRSAREAPEIDGVVRLEGVQGPRVGDYVGADVTGADGPDLVARVGSQRVAARESGA
ncbi:MAG TPA: 30S ribosomal protein S12 methylthiotransferase RimO [Actinomycetota bacterium]|nr:30S ribosomal protein S12 methylthiotransferase RimO [Actinomycetota bacterium]